MALGKRASPSIRYYLDYDHSIDVDTKLYTAFQENMIEEVLSNPEGCTLPLDLGMLKVLYNRGGAPVDKSWHRTPREERTVKPRLNNYHTDGKVFRIRWYSKVIGVAEDTIKRAFRNNDIYTFKSNKRIQSALHKIVTTTRMWTKYHEQSTVTAPRVYLARGRPKMGAVKIADGVNNAEDNEENED